MSESEAIISVSELNRQASQLLQQHFPLQWISGEISNFTCAASGHWYFSLKDARAQVRGVMFRGRAQHVDFVPQEGDKVEVRATVTLYEARGDYQLAVENMRRAGLGRLFEAFLKLKAKLEAEGLFAVTRKRCVPAYPRAIGVVTSLQAAALRDVLTVLARRVPHIPVVVYPAPVQGTEAALKIAQAIALANARDDVDVLLVCRGGGSIEDLWSFNEEVVARAIADSRLPIISGVGHETDFTIADFVADLRAPTPTAAAELAAVALDTLVMTLTTQRHALLTAMTRRLQQAMQRLDHATRRLLPPSARVAQRRQRMLQWAHQLTQLQRQHCHVQRQRLERLCHRLQQAKPDCRSDKEVLAKYRSRMQTIMQQQLQAHQAQCHSLQGKLQVLNPRQTLARGYAIVTLENGRVVRQPAQIKPGMPINLRLAEGAVHILPASTQGRLLDD